MWALCRARGTGRSWPQSRADRESVGLSHNKRFSHEAGNRQPLLAQVSRVTFLKDPQWEGSSHAHRRQSQVKINVEARSPAAESKVENKAMKELLKNVF